MWANSTTAMRDYFRETLTREFLLDHYTRLGKTAEEIGREVGCSQVTVLNYLKKHGIPARPARYVHGHRWTAKALTPEQARVYAALNREFLLDRYVEKKLTAVQIAAEVGCNPATVFRHAHQEGIPMRDPLFKPGNAAPMKGRTRSDKPSWTGQTKETNPIAAKISASMTGKSNPQLQGANHYNWKGGITPESAKIRHSTEYRVWRTAVFERDDYTCQQCKVRGGWLEAHHLIRFADRPDLRFDVANGVTLCLKCHRGARGHNRNFGKNHRPK